MFDLNDRLKETARPASDVAAPEIETDEALVDLIEESVPKSEEEVQALLKKNRTKGQGE